MKGLEKFILVIFSLFILGLAVVSIIVSLDIINVSNYSSGIYEFIISNKLFIILISIVFILFSLIGVFYSSDKEESLKSGLAIKHETGTVYITRETFESIVYNVVRSYGSLKNIKVSVTIAEQGAIANIYAYITPETVVPTVTSKLQDDIKDTVLKQTTVEIKEANIKIKGVYNQVEKKV